MTDELKQFLLANKALLQRNDFDGIYNKIKGYDRSVNKELTDFLFNIAKLNPLTYMTTIPDRMFMNVKLNSELFIPKNIKSGKIYSAQIPSVKFAANPGEVRFGACILDTLRIDEGITRIGSQFVYGCEVKKIILPESVTRVGSDAFDINNDDYKIITPYRANESDRLVIPRSEIERYKKHLKFTHAPKAEVEV